MNTFDKKKSRQLELVVYDIRTASNSSEKSVVDMYTLFQELEDHEYFNVLKENILNNIKKIAFETENGVKRTALNNFIKGYDSHHMFETLPNGDTSKVAPRKGADMNLDIDDYMERMESKLAEEGLVETAIEHNDLNESEGYDFEGLGSIDVSNTASVELDEFKKDDEKIVDPFAKYVDMDTDPMTELKEPIRKIERHVDAPNANTISDDKINLSDLDEESVKFLTEGLSAEEIAEFRSSLETGDSVSSITSEEEEKITLDDNDKLRNIKFAPNTPKEVISEYFDIISEHTFNGYIYKSVYNRLEDIYANYSSDNVKEDIVPEYKPIIEELRNDNVDTSNIKEDVIDTSKFEELFAKELRKPDPSFLSEFKGSKIEKIKAYRDAYKFGRKIFLPDSGYDVYVKKTRSQDQINFVYTLLHDYGTLDNAAVFRKNEIIRTVYENLEFYFDEEPSLTEFMSCVSERDFNLLCIMFAIVNLPEHESENQVLLPVDTCNCKRCGTPQFLKEPLHINLEEEFKSLYPLDIFLRRYQNYRNNTPANIYKAFIVPGEYGEITKLESQDEIFKYTVAVNRPTIKKNMSLLGNSEELVYDSVVSAIQERQESLRDDPTIDIDIVLAITSDTSWEEFKLNSVKYRDIDRIGLDDNEKRIFDAYVYVLGNIASAVDKHAAVFEMLRYVEAIKIEPGEDSFDDTNVNATHKDVKELFDASIMLPEDMVTKIVEVISDYSAENDYISIEFDPSELVGKFDFEGMYYTDEEALEKYKESRPNATQEQIDGFLAERANIKRQLEEEVSCPKCRAREYIITYDKILFFSAASRLSIKTGRD